jgi:hypothetical protein
MIESLVEALVHPRVLSGVETRKRHSLASTVVAGLIAQFSARCAGTTNTAILLMNGITHPSSAGVEAKASWP